MAETYMNVRSYGVLTIRIDPTNVWGDGSAERPLLRLPLELQVRPIEAKQPTIEYVLLRLTGVLKMSGTQDLADFDLGPLAENSDPRAHFRTHNVALPLDLPRVRMFEEVRSGGDAYLPLTFRGLVWFANERKFETIESQSDLQLKVPRSTWVDRVWSRWGIERVNLVDIRFPLTDAGEDYRAAYTNVEAAEKLYANGQYKQTLAELYSAFEKLAQTQGYGKPDQSFFASLLSDFHAAKKDSAKLALDKLCDFLHLGRHEPKESQETFQISRGDARFAVLVTHAVFEYITPKG